MSIEQVIALLIAVSPAGCAFFFRNRGPVRAAAIVWTLIFCSFFFVGGFLMFGPRLAFAVWKKANGDTLPPDGFLEGVRAAFEVCVPLGLCLFISVLCLGAVARRYRAPAGDQPSKSDPA